MTTPLVVQPQGAVKRSKESEESQAKIAAKKARLEKFGLKFQSAGTLVTIGEQLGRDSSIYRTPAVIQRLQGDSKDNDDGEKTDSNSSKSSNSERTQTSKKVRSSEGGGSSSDKKLSFGFQKKTLSKLPQAQSGVKSGVESGGMLPKGVYTSTWEKPGGSSREKSDASSDKIDEERKGPPPKLMSRQRELTLERAFGAESDDEDDSLATLHQLTVRSQPKKFRFNIRK